MSATRPDGLLSVATAAQRLGRSREHVRRLIHKGELRALTESGDWRVREKEITRYIDSLERAGQVSARTR